MIYKSEYSSVAAKLIKKDIREMDNTEDDLNGFDMQSLEK